MGYSADSFIAGEQPTTAKWNKLWTNDASFNDGTGIGVGAITPEKLVSGTGTSWATQTYTPTWTGSGGNPAIGNGTLTGNYTQIGKWVHLEFNLLAGSTTTFGSGTYSFGLPVTSAAIATNTAFGSVYFTTGGTPLTGMARFATTTTFIVEAQIATSSFTSPSGLTSLSPGTFANGDSVRTTFVYRAA